MIDVACALIIDNDNHLFAAQRSIAMSLPLKWELPGGKIEKNETPEECLKRELNEELSIEIKILEQLPFNTHSYPSVIIKLIPFVCHIVKGEITLQEHCAYKWLEKSQILNLEWAEADIPILYHYINTNNGIKTRYL